MLSKEKGVWVFIIFLLAGLVIGGLLGELSKGISWLWWLGYGQEFGLTEPLTLDLNVLRITFGLTIKISIASIIGMVIAIFIYKRA